MVGHSHIDLAWLWDFDQTRQKVQRTFSTALKLMDDKGFKTENVDYYAGLVYSICLNYNNRVRGARPFGKKVFMQGGVCYNKAVPVAMAAPITPQLNTATKRKSRPIFATAQIKR